MTTYIDRRDKLRNYLIYTMGHDEDKVAFAMSLLEIIDSRHCDDILEHLERENQN